LFSDNKNDAEVLLKLNDRINTALQGYEAVRAGKPLPPDVLAATSSSTFSLSNSALSASSQQQASPPQQQQQQQQPQHQQMGAVALIDFDLEVGRQGSSSSSSNGAASNPIADLAGLSMAPPPYANFAAPSNGFPVQQQQFYPLQQQQQQQQQQQPAPATGFAAFPPPPSAQSFAAFPPPPSFQQPVQQPQQQLQQPPLLSFSAAAAQAQAAISAPQQNVAPLTGAPLTTPTKPIPATTSAAIATSALPISPASSGSFGSPASATPAPVVAPAPVLVPVSAPAPIVPAAATVDLLMSLDPTPPIAAVPPVAAAEPSPLAKMHEVVAHESDAAKIVLELEKVGEVVKCKAKISNKLVTAITNLNLQLAVPKSQRLALEPLSASSIVPATFGGKPVTQLITIENPTHVPIRIRFRLSYDIPGKPTVNEQGEFLNIPSFFQ